MKAIRLVLIILIIVMAIILFNKMSHNSARIDELSLNDIIYNINENNDIEKLSNYMNPLYCDFTLERKAGRLYLTGERKPAYPWFSYKKVWVVADNNLKILSLKVSEYDSDKVKEVIMLGKSSEQKYWEGNEK